MIMKPTWLNGCSLCSIGCFLRFKWGHSCMLISLGFPGSQICSFKSSFILDAGTFLALFNRKKYRVWRAHIITVHTTIKIARPWKHPIFLRVTECLLFSICCLGCCQIQSELKWDVWGVISLWPINPIGRFFQGALTWRTAKLEILELYWSSGFLFVYIYSVLFKMLLRNLDRCMTNQSIRLVDFFQMALTSWRRKM